MGERGFSGTRMVVASCLHMLLMMAVLGLYTPLYSLLQGYFHANLVQLAMAVSVCQLVGAVCGLFAGKFLRVFKPRLTMALGGALAIAYGIVAYLWRAPEGFCAGMALCGICCGLATHGCVTDLIMRWYAERRAQMISLVLAVSMFGVALGQTISSTLYGMGLAVGQIFLAVAVGLGAAVILIALLMVRNDPEELGQRPFGAQAPANEVGAGKATPQRSQEPDFKAAIYRNPVFWLMMVAVAFTNSCSTYISSYLNTFLPSEGVDFQVGATFMIVMGYTSALFMLASGKLMERMGAMRYTMLVMVGCFVGNGSLLFLSLNFSDSLVVPVCCATLAGYTLAYPAYNIHNLLTPILFDDQAVATEANTKMIAVVYGGSALWGPVLSQAITVSGFSAFYGICLVSCALCTGCFAAAFAIARRRGMRV